MKIEIRKPVYFVPSACSKAELFISRNDYLESYTREHDFYYSKKLCYSEMSEYMKNEILEFLNRHNGGKTAEIAEALAVTDYQARYYLLLLEKEGVVQRSPLRRGMATYWLLKGEKQAGQSCSSTT